MSYAPIGGSGNLPSHRRYAKAAILIFLFGAILFSLGLSTTNTEEATLSLAGSTQHEHTVNDLPGQPRGYSLPMFAGFVDVGPASAASALFYWLFTSESTAENTAPTPLTIWLNGGPGASSLTGALLENGPIRLNDDGALTYNKYGWTNVGHFVAIDNPVGAGFSYTDTDSYVNNLGEMAEQLYEGIVNLLELHPFLADSPIFVAGESYAGKYIPAISHYIYEKHKEGDERVNLSGIAIGNGQLKPFTAYASTPDYLHNIGFIDEAQQQWAHGELAKCKEILDRGEMVEAFAACQKVEDDLYAKYVHLPFIYDVRAKSDVFTTLTRVMTDYLNKDEVRKALNVGERPWRQSDGQGPSSVGKPVPEHLKPDEMLDIPDQVLRNLFENFRVLLYSGQTDGSSCNFIGTKRTLEGLEWEGKETFAAESQKVWRVDGDVAGYGKTSAAGEAGEVSFLLIANSGHLVPTDQPLNSLNMFSRFVGGGDLFE